MTSTKRWLAGAGASAVLLLGAAVPALAQDADSSASDQATEQSEATPERDAPAGDHDCGDRPAGDAAAETSPQA